MMNYITQWLTEQNKAKKCVRGGTNIQSWYKQNPNPGLRFLFLLIIQMHAQGKENMQAQGIMCILRIHSFNKLSSSIFPSFCFPGYVPTNLSNIGEQLLNFG